MQELVVRHHRSKQGAGPRLHFWAGLFFRHGPWSHVVANVRPCNCSLTLMLQSGGWGRRQGMCSVWEGTVKMIWSNLLILHMMELRSREVKWLTHVTQNSHFLVIFHYTLQPHCSRADCLFKMGLCWPGSGNSELESFQKAVGCSKASSPLLWSHGLAISYGIIMKCWWSFALIERMEPELMPFFLICWICYYWCPVFLAKISWSGGKFLSLSNGIHSSCLTRVCLYWQKIDGVENEIILFW